MEHFVERARSKKYRFRDRDEGDVVQVEVFYSKGGMNLGTYKQEPRGVWVSIRRVSVEKTDHGEMVGYDLFTGTKFFVRGCGRMSPKKLREVAASLDAEVPGIAAAYRADKDAGVQAMKESLRPIADGPETASQEAGR